MTRIGSNPKNRRQTSIALFALLLAVTTTLRGDDAPSGAADVSFQFVRVFAPMKHIEQWPARLLPMDRDEFERLAKLLAPSPERAVVGGARIVSAKYETRLIDDLALAGTARLEIVCPARLPATLSLGDWSMAIKQAQWIDEDSPRPAVIGREPGGKPMIVVDRPGLLEIDWSLRARLAANQQPDFRFQFPPCAASELLVHLPADREPIVVAGGVGDRVESNEDADADENMATWRILPLEGPLDVRIGYRDEARKARRLTLARQTDAYELTPRGLNLSTRLQLDVYHEPLDRLTLAIDPGLRLVSVRYGNQAIGWLLADDGRSVELRFPEPLQGADQTLVVGAIGPLTTGEVWKLPRIHARDTFWQEGRATLVVRDPLALDALNVVDGQPSSPLAGGTISARFFDPEAAITAIVDWRKARARVASIAAIDLGAETTAGRLAVRYAVDRGDATTLSALVKPGWEIDSVAAADEGTVKNWTVETIGRSARLTIGFEPVRSGKPLTLIVSGRRSVATGQSIGIDSLLMLDFEDAAIDRRYLCVSADASRRLQVAGDDALESLDAAQLEADDERLFALLGDLPHERLYVVDQIDRRPNFSLKRRRPRFDAEIDYAIECRTGAIDESYEFVCRPAGDWLEQVVVHFSHARGEPLAWSLQEGGASAVSARRLDAAEQVQAGLTIGGETWLVRLAQSQVDPFTLVARRTVDWSQTLPASLAALPEANAQSGRLRIVSPAEATPRIDNRRLTAAAQSETPVDRFATVRADYSYQPMADGVESSRDAATIAPPEKGDSLQSIWAYGCRVATRASVDGALQCRALFYLENSGRRELAIQLPNGVQLDELRVDGEPVFGAAGQSSSSNPSDRQTIHNNAATIRAPLPPLRRFVTVAVDYHFDGPPLGGLAAVPALVPTIDAPTAGVEWSLWLPPGYDALDQRAERTTIGALQRTWSQRLFGPLGRGDGEGPFDPFVLGAEESDHSIASQRAAATDLLDKLGATLARHAGDDQPLEWRSLVGQIGGALLVDSPALTRRGVTPLATIDSQALEGESNVDRALALLERANLALLAIDDRLLLTADARISSDVRSAERLGGVAQRGDFSSAGPFRVVSPSAAWLADLGGTHATMAAAWSLRGGRIELPWDGVERLGENHGWSRFVLQFDGDESASIQTVHLASVQALGWSIGVLLAALFWRPLAKARRTWLVLLALAGVGALGLPAGYSALGPIFSGCILGLLGAVALRSITPAPLPVEKQAEERFTSAGGASTISAVARSVALIVGVVALSASAAAQKVDPADEKAAATKSEIAKSEKRPLHRVFFPIDEAKNPVGDKVYVPEPLYAELLRRGAAEAGGPKGAIASSAVYRAALDWRDGSLTTTSLTATIEFYAFDGPSLISIPLNEQELQMERGGVRLDGRPIDREDYEWSVDGTSLAVRTSQPGAHRLELSLQPPDGGGDDDATSGFSMSVPPLANTRLEVVAPADAPALEIRNCRGRIDVDAAGRTSAELGAIRKLRVDWPAEARGGKARMEIDQLLWMEVQPGAVLLSTRMRYEVVQGQSRRIDLAVDPRLRLLPLGDDSSVVSWRRLRDDPNVIRLDLAPSTTPRGVVDLRFLLQGTYGVGAIRLPRIEPTSDVAARRWLAVAIDPTLEAEAPSVDGVEAMAPAEFLKLWGATETKPRLAFRLLDDEPQWSLSTRRSRPRVTVEHAHRIRFRPKRMDVEFAATLSTESGEVFFHRLLLPEGMILDEAALVDDDGAQQPLRTRLHGREATLFLSAPTAKTRIAVRAHQATKASGRIRLPKFTVDQAETVAGQWRIEQDELTSVELLDVKRPADMSATPFVDSSLADDPTADPLPKYSVVARLADDGDAVDGWLVFEPNNPKVQIKSVTSIAADADKSWSVQFDCFVNVGRGRVDALRFDVPDDWTGPLIIEPPFRSKLVASAAGSPRRLVVRPDESIRGRLKFTIRGKIAPSQAAALRVPLLRPRGAATASEFVRLPTLVEEQPIVWNRRGLAPTTLPEELSITADFSMTIYRIAGGEPQAVLQAPDQAAGILRASLANVYVAWRADGSCRGLMLADVRPAGASHCLVEMPEPLALEAVRVDGRLIAAGRQSEKTWRVALPSRWRPQRLELLFSAPKESINVERSRIRLVAPTIEGAAVGRTLWTIFSPDGRRATTGAASAREIGVKERQRIRVESIARLLADDAWAPNEPGESWRRDWLDRLREEYDDFRLLAAEDDATDGRALESARQMLRQSSDETWQYVAVAVEEPATGDFVALEQVAESAQAAAIALGGRVYSSDGRRIVLRIPRDRVEQFVDQWEVDRPAGAAPLTIGNRAPWTDSMEALWRPTADRGDALYLATEGAAAVVDLRTASRSWLRELASALFFVAIVVGVGAMSRRRAVNDLAVRHAHLAGVAIGLAWWLFLSPSWFGWAIVAASLFASVRNAWPLPKSADTTITRIKIPR